MLLADGDPGPLPGVTVTRYLTPLREGGSLPGLVEGDDLGTYVCKFRGAGQGPRVLAAEIIVGELARRIGLDTPRQVVLDLSPEIARYEADEEVQDLLTASVGANLGSDFLPGSFGFDAHQGSPPEVVSTIVWLEPVPGAETPGAVREAYVAFLTARLQTRQWLPEAGGRG